MARRSLVPPKKVPPPPTAALPVETAPEVLSPRTEESEDGPKETATPESETIHLDAESITMVPGRFIVGDKEEVEAKVAEMTATAAPAPEPTSKVTIVDAPPTAEKTVTRVSQRTLEELEAGKRALEKRRT
jgi:hypothetical protein